MLPRRSGPLQTGPLDTTRCLHRHGYTWAAAPLTGLLLASLRSFSGTPGLSFALGSPGCRRCTGSHGLLSVSGDAVGAAPATCPGPPSAPVGRMRLVLRDSPHSGDSRAVHGALFLGPPRLPDHFGFVWGGGVGSRLLVLGHSNFLLPLHWGEAPPTSQARLPVFLLSPAAHGGDLTAHSLRAPHGVGSRLKGQKGRKAISHTGGKTRGGHPLSAQRQGGIPTQGRPLE